MSAEIAEVLTLTPFCSECHVSAPPTDVRSTAERWATDHDREFHSPFFEEGEDA